MLVPFKWKDSMRTYRPPSVKWILNKYREQYPRLAYIRDYAVLAEVLLTPCPGVSKLDRWATWVYMQDKGLDWSRAYNKIYNDQWRETKHVRKDKKGI